MTIVRAYGSASVNSGLRQIEIEPPGDHRHRRDGRAALPQHAPRLSRPGRAVPLGPHGRRSGHDDVGQPAQGPEDLPVASAGRTPDSPFSQVPPSALATMLTRTQDRRVGVGLREVDVVRARGMDEAHLPTWHSDDLSAFSMVDNGFDASSDFR